MSIYENGKQTEIPIYGSDRIGTYSPPQDTIINPTIFELKRGYKRYELKDHLGNVRVTVSDSKRVAFVSETLVFSADIKTYTDYYAFGMEMVGRNWSEGEAYRFGHNGQEKSKEVGEDNYTAEFWEYDSQVIRRFNTDPIVKEYESPYLAFGGNPIWFSDVNGDDIEIKGTRQERRQIRKWIKEGRKKSDTFNAMYKDLRKSKHKHIITDIIYSPERNKEDGTKEDHVIPSDYNFKTGIGTGTTIYLDTKKIKDEDVDGIIFPRVTTCGHEMAHSWMYDHGIKVSILPDANDELSAEYANKRIKHDTRSFEESNATHIENIIRSEMNISQLRETYSLMAKPVLRKEILFKEDKKNNTTFFQRDLITKPKIPNSQHVIYTLDMLFYRLSGIKGGYNYKKTKHNIHEEYKVNKK